MKLYSRLAVQLVHTHPTMVSSYEQVNNL